MDISRHDERQDTEEKDIYSMKQELNRVKLLGKNIWKEMKRLAKYLCGNDEPTHPPVESRAPRPWPAPEALRRYLPEPSRVNSLYVGWEFRKSLPLPPPHPYGRLDQPAQKSSWSFAIPQRLPFSTEELFLRVLAQAAQRAKSDRTLMDEYWGALKKARQRALVDNLVQAQNHHLHKDFPQLEWTIAGLETKTGPWALTAAHARSRVRGKKTSKSITAFEVILKTQWRVTRGSGRPMHIPEGMLGPTPVGLSGLGLGPGPLSGGEGGMGDEQDTPIIITADVGISGGPQRMPQIPVHSQTRPRQSNQSKQRPTTMMYEPQWVLVKERGKETKNSKDKNKKGRRKNAGKHNSRQKTSKPRVYVELRQPDRTAAAGPFPRGHRLSSPPGPGISHRPPLVSPLRPPPPARPASGFAPPDGDRWRAHAHPVRPAARPTPPQQTHIHMSSAQTQREEEEEKEEEEAEEVFREIFEEFSELTDPKGKKNNRRNPSESDMQVPEEQLGPDATTHVEEERRRMEMRKSGARGERGERHSQHAKPDVSISRSLMRQVEWASSRRLTAEGEELKSKSVRLEQMAEGQATPPPASVDAVQAERRRRRQQRGQELQDEAERRERWRELEAQRREQELRDQVERERWRWEEEAR